MRDALVNTDGGSDVTLVRVYPKHSAETDEAKGLVKRIRGGYADALDNPTSAEALVGGVPGRDQDRTRAPLGRGARGGPRRLAFVNAWSPLLWFALLFGLSMDYEMFLLSAVKERYEETGDNEGSVAWALERTARPISSAAIAIVAVFGSFALAGTLPPKEMGTGMAIAIALDATLIRLVLVPAAMRLMGRANWWLPRSLDRLLPRVSFGHNGGPQPALASED